MRQLDGATIFLSVPEAAAAYAVMKAREASLDAGGCAVLAKLEKFLYDSLSIDDMEQLIRETSR
jgi:hypothetical protein